LTKLRGVQKSANFWTTLYVVTMTRQQPMKCTLAGLPYVYSVIYCFRRVLAFVVSTC